MLKIKKECREYIRFCSKYGYKPSEYGSLVAYHKLLPILKLKVGAFHA